MKISYNWLKSYIPEIPKPEILSDLFTFHICEVESLDQIGEDFVFDVKILPNRAHDLLSHQGIAYELSSLLNIPFLDPTPKYKIPDSSPTDLKIEIQTAKCKRYMGRIVRNVKVGPSPEWMVKFLEAIGQRSINNIVDIANIVLFDCGNPTHVFDLDKTEPHLIIRDAVEGEEITTLDNKQIKLSASHMVVADNKNPLEIAGLKGGKIAEANTETKNIIIEVSNFDAVAVRKMSVGLNLRTEGGKRHENDLSPEGAPKAMLEFSALIAELCPEATFEDVVDVYPVKQEERKVSVSVEYINKRLGSNFSKEEIEGVWKKLNFVYTEHDGEFTINIPPLRLDLVGPHDLVEDVICMLGYDRIEERLPDIKLESKINETFAKMLSARQKLLNDGYSEVMTYVFRNKGDREVLASASDKKFIRTNLTDGLKESIKLNQLNLPLLPVKEVRVFEIGTVFLKDREEIHVAFGDKKGVIETTLEDFCEKNISTEEHGYFSAEKFLVLDPSISQGISVDNFSRKFKMWSVFPFIARDIALWVPENISSAEIEKIIKENMGNMVVRGPELFDEFKKDGRVSYAFRMVFQSYDRTLTDGEVNEVINKITDKLKSNEGWEVR